MSDLSLRFRVALLPHTKLGCLVCRLRARERERERVGERAEYKEIVSGEGGSEAGK